VDENHTRNSPFCGKIVSEGRRSGCKRKLKLLLLRSTWWWRYLLGASQRRLLYTTCGKQKRACIFVKCLFVSEHVHKTSEYVAMLAGLETCVCVPATDGSRVLPITSNWVLMFLTSRLLSEHDLAQASMLSHVFVCRWSCRSGMRDNSANTSRSSRHSCRTLLSCVYVACTVRSRCITLTSFTL
jgi:hypothetical protein